MEYMNKGKRCFNTVCDNAFIVRFLHPKNFVFELKGNIGYKTAFRVTPRPASSKAKLALWQTEAPTVWYAASHRLLLAKQELCQCLDPLYGRSSSRPR